MRVVIAGLLLTAALSSTSSASYAFNVVPNGFIAYTIDGVDNPPLTLTRGQTYTFNVTAIGHPFWIKTIQSATSANAYNTGVTNNGLQTGTLTFTVPNSAPATLFYDCELHLAMSGTIHIVNAVPAVSTIGMGALALVLLGLGGFALRRRLA